MRALVLALVLLSGCATTRGPLFPVEPPATLPPEPTPRLPSPGDCPDSVTLQAGEARDCRSRSIPPATAADVAARLDIAEITRTALDACYARRSEDRASCNHVVLALEERLAQAEAAQARAFLAGLGAGATAAALIVVAVATSAP